ncbi:MAG: hypothetical protein QM734_15115 [Cyclobacteriaceae bacterium]
MKAKQSCWHLALTSDLLHTHLLSKANGFEKIIFIITDFSGKTVSTFSMNVADFANCFAKPLKKLNHFHLSFIANNGTPGLILLQPFNVSGSVLVRGAIVAVDAASGKKLWMCSELKLYKVQATENLLIGLVNNGSGSYNSVPSYQITYVDKTTGTVVKKIPLAVQGKGYRTVPVVASNGTQLMIAGSEYESTNGKDGKFYMSMYNLSGERIFDHVDSSAVLSTRRLHMMGNVFDQEGNLVLIGEGWKPDATRMIASTAASVAIAVLSRGSYTRVYASGLDHKVENVVFATMSPMDGQVKNLKTFPVGPWLIYGTLLTEGGHAVFIVNNQVLNYDVDQGNLAPSMLTTLGMNESLTLTPSGPIVVKKERMKTTLRRLH